MHVSSEDILGFHFLAGDNKAEYFFGAGLFERFGGGKNSAAGSSDVIDEPSALPFYFRNIFFVDSERLAHIFFARFKVFDFHLGISKSFSEQNVCFERNGKTGSNCFRNAPRNNFCLIETAPAEAPRMERDRNNEVGQGNFLREDILRHDIAQNFSKIFNEAVFAGMDHAGNERVPIGRADDEAVYSVFIFATEASASLRSDVFFTERAHLIFLRFYFFEARFAKPNAVRSARNALDGKKSVKNAGAYFLNCIQV